ncbi:MAG: dockerin type I repeat-containing protein [Ruminococcus sp.]|nr:dockerin type I repeat-containing protein [Ruminococcus sp.]
MKKYISKQCIALVMNILICFSIFTSSMLVTASEVNNSDYPIVTASTVPANLCDNSFENFVNGIYLRINTGDREFDGIIGKDINVVSRVLSDYSSKIGYVTTSFSGYVNNCLIFGTTKIYVGSSAYIYITLRYNSKIKVAQTIEYKYPENYSIDGVFMCDRLAYSSNSDNTLSLKYFESIDSVGGAEHIDIPAKVRSKSVLGIEDMAFVDCNYNKSVFIPPSVKRIGNNAVGYVSCVKEVLSQSASDNLNQTQNLFDKLNTMSDDERINIYLFCESYMNITNRIINDIFAGRNYEMISSGIYDIVKIYDVSKNELKNLDTTDAYPRLTTTGKQSYIVDLLDYNCITKVEQYKIYGYSNTVAEQYAEANEIEFVPLEDNRVTGDVNGDGLINVLDVSELQKYIVSLVEFDDAQKKVADVNFDGIINVSDVSDIQKYIVNLIIVFKDKNELAYN